MKPVSLLLTAVATFGLAFHAFAQGPDAASADALWQKVDEALTNLKGPKEKPKSRDEAIEWFKKAVTVADTQGAAFLAKYPNDPRRWQIRLFEGLTANTREQVGVPVKGDMKTALADILKSTDADLETKSEASAITVLEAGGELEGGKGDTQAWITQAEAHLKAYPDGKRNAMIQGQMKSLQMMADLKTKPLELKFKAVDGREVDLTKLQGKVVLLDFWATWCGPCIAEVPNVVKAYEKLHGKGFEIVGISLDQDKDKLEAFTKEKGMTWPQYFDGKGWENEFAQKYGVHSIPAMWLVNKKGIVISTEARENMAEQVEKALAE